MADYVPKYVEISFCRNFTTPPLDYTDVSEAELLARIEAIETYCTTIYGTGDKVACSLLVLSKLISNPTLAKKYGMLNAETIGRYSYRLGPTSASGKTSFDIAKSWEDIAYEILRQLAYKNSSHTLSQGIFITNS